MKLADAIEQLLKQNAKKKGWMAETLGWSSPSAVGNTLRRGNMTIETLLKLCDALGYEISVQPKRRAGSRPNGQIVIDGLGREEEPNKTVEKKP